MFPLTKGLFSKTVTKWNLCKNLHSIISAPSNSNTGVALTNMLSSGSRLNSIFLQSSSPLRIHRIFKNPFRDVGRSENLQVLVSVRNQYCMKELRETYTVFLRIVSAETILFWKLDCGKYSREETIQGRKLLIYCFFLSIHNLNTCRTYL